MVERVAGGGTRISLLGWKTFSQLWTNNVEWERWAEGCWPTRPVSIAVRGANGTYLAAVRGGELVEVNDLTEEMLDTGTTMSANDEAARFLRESGALQVMQQDALEVNLRCVADSQGFELVHISHRHHPAVELSLHMGDSEEHRNTVRLRSEVCRLLHAASVRVSASKVFASYRRAVVRVACVPQWD
jgi:hypothetical protein